MKPKGGGNPRGKDRWLIKGTFKLKARTELLLSNQTENEEMVVELMCCILCVTVSFHPLGS